MPTRVTMQDVKRMIDHEAESVYAIEEELRRFTAFASPTLANELVILYRRKDVRAIRAAFRATLRHPTFQGANVKLYMGRSPRYSWALQTWTRDEAGEGIVRKHEVVMGKWGRCTYTLLHELAHVACSHAQTDAQTVQGGTEAHGPTWRAMLCHLLRWSGFPETARELAGRFNAGFLPTSNAWELNDIVLRNADVSEHSGQPVQASWSPPTWATGLPASWAHNPPRCPVCSVEHHACDCAALEARERVKCKRAIRLWLMQTRGLTSAQACAIIGTGGAA